MNEPGGPADAGENLQAADTRFAGYIETRTSVPRAEYHLTSDVVANGEWLMEDPEQLFPVDFVRMRIVADAYSSPNPDPAKVYSLDFMWQGQAVFSLMWTPRRGFAITNEFAFLDVDDDRAHQIMNRLETLENQGQLQQIL